MDLDGWRLFGWSNLEGWTMRDLQDEIFVYVKRFEGMKLKIMWRDLKGWNWKLRNNPCKWGRNYKIPL